jgi:WD40 repeat protein
VSVLLETKLKPVASATWDAHELNIDTCLPGTRVKLLQDITLWLQAGPSGAIVFWLNGLAGTGKSTVARTLCESLGGNLGAAFFISRNSLNRRTSVRVLNSLVYQLACRDDGMRSCICAALRADPDLASASLNKQILSLVVDSLRKRTDVLEQIVLVLDALDECDKENGYEGGQLLPLLVEALIDLPTVRLFVTSRDEVSIGGMFARVVRQRPGASETIALHNIEHAIVQTDIYAYLAHSFQAIAAEWMEHAIVLGDGWPGEQALQELLKRAGVLFIFAATVVRHIRGEPGMGDPGKRLRALLADTQEDVSYKYDMLDRLYRDILLKAANLSNEDQTRFRLHMHEVLGALAFVQEPATPSALAQLLDLEPTLVNDVLCRVAAVVVLNDNQPIRLFHPSFQDFISDRNRCQNEVLHVDVGQQHLRLALYCLRLMNSCLTYDICDIRNPGIANRDMQDRVQEKVTYGLRYACRHWVTHLISFDHALIAERPELLEALRLFCQHHLLHWIEVISLLGQVPTVHEILPDAMAWCKVSERGCRITRSVTNTWTQKHAAGECVELLGDIRRVIEAYGHPITSHVLQVYYTALYRMPRCALLEASDAMVKRGFYFSTMREARWPALLQTFNCQSAVFCVAYSLDGRHIVSGSFDKTVRIWDAIAGKEVSRLKGHTDSVLSVAFSPNGRHIVSGSHDRTLRMWDAFAGKEVSKLNGHMNWVTSVALSSDGRHVVSSSHDNTVRIWDSLAGKEVSRLEGHAKSVRSVAFSPDGQHVVSGSEDNTVRIWDALAVKEVSRLEGHTNWVRSVAFSPDGQHVVSGSRDSTVRIWDASAGKEVSRLEGHTDSVWSVAFSPDCQHVVSGSSDNTVRIWDALAGKEVSKLEGHASTVWSVAFSPDGQHIVSGSGDNTVRIWDTLAGKEVSKLNGHMNSVMSVAFSSNGGHVVPGSYDNAVRIRDAFAGEEVSRLEGHTRSVRSVAFSPDCQHVVSGSGDNTVRIWDALAGKEVSKLEGHASTVWSVAFSPDGQHIVSGSGDNTVRIWDALAGKEVSRLEGHTNWVRSVAFSPDGRHIVSGSYDNTVRIWNVLAGKEVSRLEGHTFSVNSVAFSPDGQHVVSGSHDRTVRIWDALAGKEVRRFKGHTDWVRSVAFSPDGQHIVSGSEDNTVRIWDVLTRLQVAILHHGKAVHGVSWTHQDWIDVEGTAWPWTGKPRATLATRSFHPAHYCSRRPRDHLKRRTSPNPIATLVMGCPDWLDLTEDHHPFTHPSLLVFGSAQVRSARRGDCLLRYTWRSEDRELHEHASHAERGGCTELATLCPVVGIHPPKRP